jgi:hypothetical protein
MTDGDVNLALAYPPHKHRWTICECGMRKRSANSLVERNEEARRLIVDEGLTLEAVGKALGITRARVWQITNRMGIKVGVLHKARTAARMEAERNKPSICSFCSGEYKRGRREFDEHYRSAHPHAKIKPEDIEKYLAMVADYDAGLTNYEIMAKYNCQPTLVYRALAYVGREHNRRNSSRLPTMAESKARQEAIIADLKTKTMFAYEIAEKYGVSTGLIHFIAKKYDVGMSLSEAIKMRYARAKAS